MISRNGSNAIFETGRTVLDYSIVLAVWLVFGFAGVGELFAAAPLAKVIQWDSDVDAGAAYLLTPTRGETMVLQPRFVLNDLPMDLSHAYTVYLLYKPVGSTNVYSISGSVLDAEKGIGQIEWTPANEFSVSTYAFDILVSGASSTVVAARGAIKLRDGVAYDATLTDVQPINILDFDTTILLNVGNAPFLSSYEINDIRSYLTAIQTGLGDIDAKDVTVRGTLNYTNWPGYLARTSDIPSAVSVAAGANISVAVTTNAGRIIYTVTGAAGGGSGGGGGIGSYTNTSINGVANTNSIQLADGVNSSWTRDTNGIWRLDLGVLRNIVGSNSVQITVDGQLLWDISTNRTMVYTPSLMWSGDYVGVMEFFAGSRLAPSIKFYGHPTGFGLYERGYNGAYGAGWSVGGTEIGILHSLGIKLVSTNSAFEGRLVGDISGATGYPEPLWSMWVTNRQLPSLTITNSGHITGKDAGGTTRFDVDSSTGATIIRSQDSDDRYALAATNATGFAITNVFAGVTNRLWFSAQGTCLKRP